MKPSSSPLRVLLAVGAGTCLSLLGDVTMYTVLPTHTREAGIGIAAVGIILSANRWVRVALNSPMGMAYDRWKRRPLFVAALFIGALSTTIYGLSEGFWPLLAGRLLWGLSWAGIWVGGNSIILDITNEENRGHWMGFYQISFFLGAASGSFVGGILTDQLGYHTTMVIHAGLTLLGAIIALVLLPETSRDRFQAKKNTVPQVESPSTMEPANRTQLYTATTLYAVNRIVVAGMLTSTLGLYLLEQIGESFQFAGHSLGVATLTGIGLGTATLTSMLSAPFSGILSDKMKNRWRTATGGLLPGVLGFSLLAIGTPWMIPLGIPLIAATSGSNQGLSTTLVGETGLASRQSRRLGILFTVGDFASAVGSLLAYALIPVFPIRGIYILGASLFIAVFVPSFWLGFRPSSPMECP